MILKSNFFSDPSLAKRHMNYWRELMIFSCQKQKIVIEALLLRVGIKGSLGENQNQLGKGLYFINCIIIYLMK